MRSFNIFDKRWFIWDIIRNIEKMINEHVYPIESFNYITKKQNHINDYTQIGSGTLHVGESWSEKLIYEFSVQIKLPDEFTGENLYFIFDSPGEGELYVDGKIIGSIDPVHKDVFITNSVESDKTYDLKVNITKQIHDYAKMERFLGIPYPRHVLNNAYVCSKNTILMDIKYYLEYLFSVMTECPEEDVRNDLFDILEKYLTRVNFKDSRETIIAHLSESKEKISNDLKNSKYNKHYGKINYISHSHLDVVFKWLWMETVPKIARTISNTCSVLERYNECTYTQSQMKLIYELEKNYPELFERALKLIKEGRLEVVGDTWVEFDSNMSWGESLVRQILYGKKYAHEHLGTESDTMFLPDTFGYTAILPQILKQMNYKYFTTAKMNWNDTNPFPYCVFNWKGIDGSVIPGMNFSTYGGDVYFYQLPAGEGAKKGQPLKTQCQMYGESDGGGGISEEMALQKRAMRDSGILFNYCDSTLSQTADEMYKQVAFSDEGLPEINGEIYLEAHRGTLTSQALIKKYNRRAEGVMRDLELFATLAYKKQLIELYPARQIEELWKNILFNQFHDILAGSMIHASVLDAHQLYQRTFEESEIIINENIHKLLGNYNTSVQCSDGVTSLVVLNTLNWKRDCMCYVPASTIPYESFDIMLGNDVIKYIVTENVDGTKMINFNVESIPAYGYNCYNFIETEKSDVSYNATNCLYNDLPSEMFSSLENKRYLINFDNEGNISRILNKNDGNELLAGKSNVLSAYVDKSGYFNCWEINHHFTNFPVKCILESITPHEQNDFASTVKVVKRIKNSIFEQLITIYNNSPRIDFKTNVDMKDSELFVRVAFDTGIMSENAQYDLSMGFIERANMYDDSNTIESAKFEVGMHKWQALKNKNGNGIALLNNCKYGGKTKNGVISQTLIKTAVFPDESQDLTTHEFTYSLLPFNDEQGIDYVTKQAYELNNPVKIINGNMTDGVNLDLAEKLSLINIDFSSVIVQSIKCAEDGSSDVIIRIYEHEGIKKSLEISADSIKKSFGCTNMWLCDPLENKTSDTLQVDGKYEIVLNPFEMKTIRLK